MNSSLFENSQRQSPLGVAVNFVRNLRKGFQIYLSIFIVQFGMSSDGLSFSTKILFGVISIGFFIYSYFQYARFKFRVSKGHFILEKGVFTSDKIDIPLSRIQSIHLNQNPIQRILKVYSLKIETAGSSNKEIEIPALKKDYAEQLRLYLSSESKKLKKEEISTEQGDNVLTDLDSSKTSKIKRVLHSLKLKDVLWVGLSENHLRSGFVLLALINGYLWQFEEYFDTPISPYLETEAERLINYSLFIFPIALLIFLIISVLFSLILSTLRFWDLSFSEDEDYYFLESGLLSKRNLSIPKSKLQVFKSVSNPLQRLVNYSTVSLKAASARSVNDNKSLQVPGISPIASVELENTLFEEMIGANNEIKSQSYLRRRLSIYLIMPIVVLGSIAGILISYYILIPVVLYLSLAMWFISMYVDSVKMIYNKDQLVLHKGYVFRKKYRLELFRLQAVRMNQSIFQDRQGLVSLVLFSANGQLSIWDIKKEEGELLYNICLQRIESSNQNWM